MSNLLLHRVGSLSIALVTSVAAVLSIARLKAAASFEEDGLDWFIITICIVVLGGTSGAIWAFVNLSKHRCPRFSAAGLMINTLVIFGFMIYIFIAHPGPPVRGTHGF